MRAIKVLMVSLTAVASLAVGVAAAAPASHDGAPSATRWCC
jgi:hypothetical protein